MTAVTPRLPIARLARRRPFAAIAGRIRAGADLPRTPAFVVVCATVGVLNIVGLVMILSASSVAALSDYGSSWYFFQRQFLWALFGVVAFAVGARVDYHRWRRAAPVLLFLSAALCTLVLVPDVGISVDGSRRWLGVGALRMQPSELAKLALLLAAAEILVRRGDRIADARAWRPVLVVGGVLAVLVSLEPDLDTTIVLGLITFALLAVAGARAKHLALLASCGALAATYFAFSEDYRRARMFTFLDPSADPMNAGYQIKQSLIALGSGGVDGVGLGAGRAKWQFLPNPHTDFIFAIVGEELGFVGALLVLGLFAGFGLVGLHVARRAPDRYGALLAVGITAWIAGQAAINLGAVVGVLPVAGITLPFLSAGGSSLVITMLAAGIVANVARRAPQAESRARPRPRRAPSRPS